MVLYYKTVTILLSNRGAHRKSKLFYALFSSIMVFGMTVWIATAAIFGEKMWLVHSDFPGGPDMYWKKNISVWYMAWASSASILLQLMADGLMLGHIRGCHNVCLALTCHRCAHHFVAVDSWWVTPALNPFGRLIPCLPGLRSPLRLDRQFAREKLLQWSRCSIGCRVLYRLPTSEHTLNVHDTLPYSATWEESR